MSMTATAGSETRLRAPHLPYPPTDVERDSYFKRYLGPLTVLSTVGMLGITASAARFAISRPALAPYIAVVTFAALYFLISLRVNALSRDASLEEHRIRVALWTPLRCPSVDVMLPTCGEDHDVLYNTWMHVAALTWSGDLDVYVLDDADDPVARAMAEEFGFTYLVRPNRGWFKKAGNLRHGYENSSGDLIVVFDADFCPRTDFLHELVPYFDNPDVGIVQSPQHFRVLDSQGWLERGAGAVQEFFYRAVQMSRERRNGAICVGTNAIYRRAALESNGGTTLIEHSEDVHTGFDLRRNGWVLRYVPVVLATGLCPDELPAFFRQQYRWCMGSMSLLLSGKFWRTKMALRTRLCYVSGFCYYLATASFTFVAPVIPLVLLLAAPHAIRIENYAILAPGLIYGYVVFPMWHRCRYGLESWTVRLIYGWAHLFAIVDLVRKRPMGWTPTGARERRDRRVEAFRALALGWGGGTALLWTSAAAWHAVSRPVDFAPMLVLGAFQFAVVFRLGMPTRGSARETKAVESGRTPMLVNEGHRLAEVAA